jgi:anti-anti-sigma regulatory factor
MLRITRLDGPQRTILKLEGRLMGTWVDELARYRDSIRCPKDCRLIVDLGGVTFIDEAGKILLEQMWKQGARLEATGCLTEAIVNAITRQAES